MSGPARAGLFVYAKDPERIASFYQAIANMVRLVTSPELIVIASPDIQLVVHAIPQHIADEIVITIPPQRRADTALKFFFTVTSLKETESIAASLGGAVFSEDWQGPGFIVCNAMDPEGNVFQVRERTSISKPTPVATPP